VLQPAESRRMSNKCSFTATYCTGLYVHLINKCSCTATYCTARAAHAPDQQVQLSNGHAHSRLMLLPLHAPRQRAQQWLPAWQATLLTL
jgi:hypothetical protein